MCVYTIRLPRPVLIQALVATLAFAACLATGRAVPPADLVKEAPVQAMLEEIKRNEPETIELQVKLTEIPAPPFKEEVRAAAVKKLFEQYGLQNVFIDRAGNVVGTRPGAQKHPHVVLSAHLDTVFPEGTDVTVKRDGKIVKSATHGHGPACSGIRKMVEFDVTPGRYLLQIVNAPAQSIRAMAVLRVRTH